MHAKILESLLALVLLVEQKAEERKLSLHFQISMGVMGPMMSEMTRRMETDFSQQRRRNIPKH